MTNPTRWLPLVALCVGCGPQLAEDGDDAPASLESELKIPTENRIGLVDVGSWNVEWYGSAANGPDDEALQQANVKQVVAGMNLDLLGLTEVVSAPAFHALVAAARNHDGLLATDPIVEQGAQFYSANEQKVGLVFHRRFHVDRARVVLTEHAFDFGGRPPLEVTLSFIDHGRPMQLVVLVVHLKAMADLDGYRRRAASAVALKDYLDEAFAGRFVAVIGDFNDDLFSSTRPGAASPFEAFVEDETRYQFSTQALSEARISTTVAFTSTIDHHLANRALADHYVPGSAKVVRPDAVIAGYGATTSDHYPVVTRYDLR